MHRSRRDFLRTAAAGLADDDAAAGRIEIGQRDLAFEPGLDRPDLDLDGGFEIRVRQLGNALAAGNALAQDFRIVQRRPDLGAGSGN